jgi:hypothetical protein
MDTALVTLGNRWQFINYIFARKAMDLAHYNSGGGLEGLDDQAEFSVVRTIIAEECSSILKDVRENVGGNYGTVIGIDCGTGALDGDTGGMVSGRALHIDRLFLERPKRYGVDWRDMRTGCSIGSVTVRNPGRNKDGSLSYDPQAAIRFSSAKLAQLGQVLCQYEGYDPVPGLPAVVMNGGGNYGISVDQLLVERFDEGIKETGDTSNDTAITVTGKMVDVATPLNPQPGSRLRYDIEDIDTSGSQVTSARYTGIGRNAIIRDRVDFAPFIEYGGDDAAITLNSDNRGERRRVDGGWMIRCLCDWTQAWTGAPPTGTFRIDLAASGLVTAQGVHADCVITKWNGNIPFPSAGTALAGYYDKDGSKMRFQSMAPGRNGLDLTADDFVAVGTGKTFLLKFQLFIPDSLDMT